MPDWSGRRYRLLLPVATLFLLLLAGNALAEPESPESQPPSAPRADTADQSGTESPETLMEMILGSGVSGWSFMVVLLAFSVAATMVAIERAINTRRSKIIPPEFVAELNGLLQQGQAGAGNLHLLCARWSVPAAKVLQAGLLRQGRPLTEVEKSMEDAATREMATLRGGIRPLNVIANVAPLVGLLGTVLGMIIAFRVASQAGLGKGEQMAEGIYLALLTTAAGLTIAIPSLLLAAWFSSRVDKLFREIDECLMYTMPAFARMEVPHTETVSRPSQPAAVPASAAH